MSEDLIRYDILTQDALRIMIAKLLDEISRTGLPGDHHFFITFDTGAPGVKLSPRMKEKYPEEMTIVVQHRFWELEVSEEKFQIGLSFDEIAELLVIPFAAVKGFYDPSVKFGLQFEVQLSEELPMGDAPAQMTSTKIAKSSGKSKKSKGKKSKPEMFEEPLSKDELAPDVDAIDPDDPDDTTGTKSDDDTQGAQVVSLDAFRKKK